MMSYHPSRWAPRANRDLELRAPDLLAGPGIAVHGDAVSLVRDGSLGSFDLAYLDPPYNRHRYTANYHVWETLVAWDAPEHYGVACRLALHEDRALGYALCAYECSAHAFRVFDGYKCHCNWYLMHALWHCWHSAHLALLPLLALLALL